MKPPPESMMISRAGKDPDEVRRIQDRAKEAEEYLAWFLRGEVVDPDWVRGPDRCGDVVLRDGERVEAKSVPTGFRFVNGGNYRPMARVYVVEGESRFRIAGTVEVGAWRWGLPPVKNAQPCWFVEWWEVSPLPGEED